MWAGIRISQAYEVIKPKFWRNKAMWVPAEGAELLGNNKILVTFVMKGRSSGSRAKIFEVIEISGVKRDQIHSFLLVVNQISLGRSERLLGGHSHPAPFPSPALVVGLETWNSSHKKFQTFFQVLKSFIEEQNFQSLCSHNSSKFHPILFTKRTSILKPR